MDRLPRFVAGQSGSVGARRRAGNEAIDIPEPPPFSGLGASSASVLLAPAGSEATRAAARYAIAQRADPELSAELCPAARRLRALRDRWIPQHEKALSALDLARDEAQREQAIHIRLLTRRNGSGIGAPGRLPITDAGRQRRMDS